MKRLAILCMILVLLLQVFSGTAVYGASQNLKVTYELPNNEADIYDGQSFLLRLKCTNLSGQNMTNIKVDINEASSSFSWMSTVPVSPNDMPAGAAVQSFDLPKLTYEGKGKYLTLEITYKLNGTDTSEQYAVYISEAHSTDTSSGSSTSSDASKLVPKLGTANGNSIPEMIAGNSQTVTYSVKNSSIYQAKDITMTLKMADEDKAPLVLGDLDLRQTADLINGNDIVPVTFNIRILKTAPAGLYTMKLNYAFQSAYGYDFTSSETVYIRVINNDSSPKLTVETVSVKQNEASSGFDLNLKIKNLSSLAARDVKLTLKGLKSGGITTLNSTDVQYLDKIDAKGASTVTYRLQLSPSAAAGSNELSVKMDFKDAAGTAYSEENQIFVPMGADANSKPSIVFDKIASPQEVLTINKDFQVSMDLKNSGGTAAKNIKVTLTTDKEIITKSLSPIYIEKLDKNAVKNVAFKLFATEDATTRNYPLAVNVEYEDLYGTKYTASQYVGVYVENGNAKTVPRIIVEKYTIDPLPVHAASDFTVKMSFLNTSSKTDVSNIKVTVTSDDGTFAPTDSGNTFYIDAIPSGKSVEKELMFHVKPDADQKSYVLTVNFEYEDSKGNPYTSKETMSVRVLQNPRLVTGELVPPTEAFVGQPVSLYIDFYNMGKSTLYNMMVKAVGNFSGQNLSYYVGNFASGSTDAFDTSITPTSPGALKGEVVFSFEDANGSVTEVRKEFSVNVMDMPQQGQMLDENGIPIDKGMGMVNGEPGKMPGQKTNLLIYIIPAVVVVLGIVTFIVLRKRHKRRKELSLDE